MGTEIAATDKRRYLAQINKLNTTLEKASTPEEVRSVQIALDALDDAMASAGLFTVEERRLVNEARIRARAKLGRLLEQVERTKGKAWMSRPETSNFRDYLKELGLDKSRAVEVQRLAAIPDPVLDKRFQERAKKGELTYISTALEWSQPFWKIKHRDIKHATIKRAAAATVMPDVEIGPFPLIYADPPWRFVTWSESGGGKSPDQHYPTMTDEDILAFKVAGKRISEIAHKDAALFLWCTSSNLPLALDVMDRWGFAFRTSAVWVKPGIGTGQIFRNRHEVLLYGTKGKMPGPVLVPPSVFEYPKGAHSVKPPEIRKLIERMYPSFNAADRLELFHRGTAPSGWTTYGYESGKPQ